MKTATKSKEDNDIKPDAKDQAKANASATKAVEEMKKKLTVTEEAREATLEGVVVFRSVAKNGMYSLGNTREVDVPGGGKRASIGLFAEFDNYTLILDMDSPSKGVENKAVAKALLYHPDYGIEFTRVIKKSQSEARIQKIERRKKIASLSDENLRAKFTFEELELASLQHDPDRVSLEVLFDDLDKEI